MLTKYDRERLKKWADNIAWEIIQKGDRIEPFRKAANIMIKDIKAVVADIGICKEKDIIRYYTFEY